MTEFKTNERCTAAMEKLLLYCQSNNWAGYDPYDALNSKLFAAVPLLDRRIPRLVLTQALKRFPINIRPILAIPKKQNPKGLALFLSTTIKLDKMGAGNRRELTDFLIQRIREMRSPGVAYWCWGYSFPWQTRTIVVPSGTPNLVCTIFVANALFDAYDHNRDSNCLNMALSAAEYIHNELFWNEGATASFSYPLPSVRSEVHNANFLAAALLGRAFNHTGDKKFLGHAFEVARCSAAKQRADGSWYYGEAASQRWIDNFHTGYNLCALREFARFASTTEFDPTIQRGFEFYRDHFFCADGSVRYFHDRTYPIDIHCVAQSIITLLAFKDTDSRNLPLAQEVLSWALNHMCDNQGFFYYQIHKLYSNRISYMRWSQAWMLFAMAGLQEALGGENAAEKATPLAELAQ